MGGKQTPTLVMNHSPENETQALRSNIDDTRRRMDDTMDELGDRLQPRHVLDEIVGFFRGNGTDGDSRMSRVKDKVSDSADRAVHAVASTVRAHPLPILAIGAGVAWLIYESRRARQPADASYEGGYSPELQYDPDEHYDRPLEYPEGYREGQMELGEQTGSPSKLGAIKEGVKEKASAVTARVKDGLGGAGEQVREKASALKEATREKLGAARQRAAELGAQAQEKAKQAGRRVAATAEHHPLETGLVCLAAGLIAGLALRTPDRVNRVAGAQADRLRQRARDMGEQAMAKGRRVVESAAHAAQEEARTQGLMSQPDAEKPLPTLAEDTTTAPGREDFGGGGSAEAPREENAGIPAAGDPSSARPR